MLFLGHQHKIAVLRDTLPKESNIRIPCTLHKIYVTDDKGFEPLKRVNVYTLSKRAPSAARPIIQNKKTEVRLHF